MHRRGRHAPPDRTPRPDRATTVWPNPGGRDPKGHIVAASMRAWVPLNRKHQGPCSTHRSRAYHALCRVIPRIRRCIAPGPCRRRLRKHRTSRSRSDTPRSCATPGVPVGRTAHRARRTPCIRSKYTSFDTTAFIGLDARRISKLNGRLMSNRERQVHWRHVGDGRPVRLVGLASGDRGARSTTGSPGARASTVAGPNHARNSRPRPCLLPSPVPRRR